MALILGLFVVRPLLARGAEVPFADGRRRGGPAGREIDDDYELPELPGLGGFGGDDDGGGFPMMADFDGGGGAEDDPVAKLQALIEDRRDETMEILRSWLEEDEGAGMKPIARILEDFGRPDATAPPGLSEEELETIRLEAFENGYKAGWGRRGQGLGGRSRRISAPIWRAICRTSSPSPITRRIRTCSPR